MPLLLPLPLPCHPERVYVRDLPSVIPLTVYAFAPVGDLVLNFRVTSHESRSLFCHPERSGGIWFPFVILRFPKETDKVTVFDVVKNRLRICFLT